MNNIDLKPGIKPQCLLDEEAKQLVVKTASGYSYFDSGINKSITKAKTYPNNSIVLERLTDYMCATFVKVFDNPEEEYVEIAIAHTRLGSKLDSITNSHLYFSEAIRFYYHPELDGFATTIRYLENNLAVFHPAAGVTRTILTVNKMCKSQIITQRLNDVCIMDLNWDTLYLSETWKNITKDRNTNTLHPDTIKLIWDKLKTTTKGAQAIVRGAFWNFTPVEIQKVLEYDTATTTDQICKKFPVMDDILKQYPNEGVYVEKENLRWWCRCQNVMVIHDYKNKLYGYYNMNDQKWYKLAINASVGYLHSLDYFTGKNEYAQGWGQAPSAIINQVIDMYKTIPIYEYDGGVQKVDEIWQTILRSENFVKPYQKLVPQEVINELQKTFIFFNGDKNHFSYTMEHIKQLTPDKLMMILPLTRKGIYFSLSTLLLVCKINQAKYIEDALLKECDIRTLMIIDKWVGNDVLGRATEIATLLQHEYLVTEFEKPEQVVEACLHFNKKWPQGFEYAKRVVETEYLRDFIQPHGLVYFREPVKISIRLKQGSYAANFLSAAL